jgi:hypothetical protein
MVTASRGTPRLVELNARGMAMCQRRELHVFKKVIITSVVAAVATLGAAGIAYADTDSGSGAHGARGTSSHGASHSGRSDSASTSRDSDSGDATSRSGDDSDRYNTDTTAGDGTDGADGDSEADGHGADGRDGQATHKYSLLGGL